jgi:hypothetical protein
MNDNYRPACATTAVLALVACAVFSALSDHHALGWLSWGVVIAVPLIIESIASSENP